MKASKARTIFKLGEVEEFSLAQLKSQYKQLAMEKHPDKGGDAAEFIELREAYLVLLEFAKQEDSAGAATEEKSTDLKTLSKEEILKKYFDDTEDLQTQLQSFQKGVLVQVKILTEVKEKAESLVQAFDQKKQFLRKELELEIAHLEKKINPSFWQKFFFFFLPGITEEQFWKYYDEQVKVYTRKDLELDNEFFQEMINLYGKALNKVSQSITEI